TSSSSLPTARLPADARFARLSQNREPSFRVLHSLIIAHGRGIAPRVKSLTARLIPVGVTVVCALVGSCSSEGAKHKAAGNVLFKEHDWGGALREYRAALALHPRDPGAHTLLGNALFEVGEYDAAAAEYRTALDLDPHLRGAMQGLATVFLRREEWAQAK